MGLVGRLSGGGLTASPLLLSTALVSLVGWLVAFVGQSALESKRASHMPYVWFGIWAHLAAIVFFTYAAQTYTFASFRSLIIALLTLAIVFGALAADQTVYTSSGADDAASARATASGYIILLAVEISWLIMVGSAAHTVFGRLLGPAGEYLGSVPPAPRGVNTDPYGRVLVDDDRATLPRSSHSVAPSTAGGAYGSVAGFTSSAGGSPSVVHVIPTAGQAGETISMAPVGQQHGSFHDAEELKPTEAPGMTGPSLAASSPLVPSSPTAFSANPTAHIHATAEARETIRARALYAYTASPDDPNELSFTKGEVLDVLDLSGKWWQVRNARGERGIVPSNYMQRLQ